MNFHTHHRCMCLLYFFQLLISTHILDKHIPQDFQKLVLQEYQIQKCLGFCTDVIDGYKGFIFSTSQGTLYQAAAINQALHRIQESYNKEEMEKAKKERRDPVLLPEFSCHHLRHTFCTRFCENETNIKVIQEIMGHADIETTMNIYAEATKEKKMASFAQLDGKIKIG